MWNLASHINKIPLIVFWKQGAEENIFIYGGWRDRILEKTAWWGAFFTKYC
jgi:hypothetical protein